MSAVYHVDEELAFEEVFEFLARTGLGSQYPRERFRERMTETLRRRSIGVSARDPDVPSPYSGRGRLVGLLLGLSDFAYHLFLTDLGVDRDYVRQGIGRELVRRAHEAVGGADGITVVTISHGEALPFYDRIGFRTRPFLLWKPCRVWTPFEVRATSGD